ncbi:MAG: phage holin family protein, partial [Thermoanaerobaculia bacterium]
MRFILRLCVNAAALWVATAIVPGVTYSGDGAYLFLVALVFGLM